MLHLGEESILADSTFASIVSNNVLLEAHTQRVVGCSIVPESQCLTLGTSPVPSAKQLIGQNWEASLSYRKSFISLHSLYYFTTSQFHSLQFVTLSHVNLIVCMWCMRICRWVIDGVLTLNITGIGLHFLHILCLKKTESCHERSFTCAGNTEGSRIQNMLQKNNPPVRILMASYLTVGIAWHKMDTQTSSVTQQTSMKIFTVIDV